MRAFAVSSALLLAAVAVEIASQNFYPISPTVLSSIPQTFGTQFFAFLWTGLVVTGTMFFCAGLVRILRTQF